MSCLRLAAAGVFFLWACAAHAETPIASFARGQLEYAEAALERARVAQASGDAALARRYAAQAELDARLVWSMTDSGHLRRAAATVARHVAQLRHELLAGNRGQGRNSRHAEARPKYDPDPDSRPDPRPATYDPRADPLPSVDLSSSVTRR